MAINIHSSLKSDQLFEKRIKCLETFKSGLFWRGAVHSKATEDYVRYSRTTDLKEKS